MASFGTQMISPIFFASSELTPFSGSLQWFLQLQVPTLITCMPQPEAEFNKSANKVWIESSWLKLARLVVLTGLAWVRTPAIVPKSRARSDPMFLGQEEGRVASQ